MPAPVRLRDWDWRESGPGDFADAELGGVAVLAVAMVVFLVIWPIVAIALELILLGSSAWSVLLGGCSFAGHGRSSPAANRRGRHGDTNGGWSAGAAARG